MNSIETRYYDNASLWEPDRYLGNEDELRRFTTCVSLVPAQARSLLDVGTGNGAFLQVLEQARPALQTVGVERSKAAIERGVCSAEILHGSSDLLPAADATFDVVSALEVIEHLPFQVYEASLAEMERVARTWVLISVPFREDRLYVRCPYCNCEFNPHFHMRRFTEERMRGLMPTFACIALQTVKAPDVVSGILLKSAYRWARKRTGYFPAQAICPQCGFNRAGSRTDPTAEDAGVGRSVRLGRSLRTMLPKRMRAKWIVGLYQRPARMI